MKLKFWITNLLNGLVALSFLCGQTPLQSYLDKAADHSIYKSANLSLSIYEVDSHTEIASHRSQKVATPASSLKLFTTLSGIHYLGEDFRFETIIGYTGHIDDSGTLKGNLVIKGGGDPTLGSSKIKGNKDLVTLLDHIKTQVIDQGINCIDGDIVIDESIYDSYPIAPTWQWNDLGNYYATGAWGVNVNENQYRIYFKKRGVIGQRPFIHSTEPIINNLELSNEIVVDSSHTGDQAYIFGGPYNFKKRIVGTIPQGAGTFTIKGAIPDPPTFLGEILQSTLHKAHIQSGSVKNIFRAQWMKFHPIDTLYSPPLSIIVKQANAKSNNLYTEAILKMIGLKKNGQGSGQNGLAAVKRLLRKYGVDTPSLHLHDGSGLSARNLISAKSMAQFLSGLSSSIDIDQVTSYIPRGGMEGTVRGMFGGSSIKGHIWLKSGSMEGVQSYSGYIKSKSGKWYSFSLIVNGYSSEPKKIRSQLQKMIIGIYNKLG